MHPPTTLREMQHAAESGLVVVAGGLHPGQSTNGTAALVAEKVRASEFLNATDVNGVYEKDPKVYKNAKKIQKIELRKLRNMLAHEDTIAGGYDLMDIVALKVIERSRIKTRILKADTAILERVIKGASEFLNATDVNGVYEKDPKVYKNAKKIQKIELRKLRNMLAHEDTIAGGYDLMDIVALKVIERSRIKTRILKADTAILERVIKGGSGGTEIIHSKKKRAR